MLGKGDLIMRISSSKTVATTSSGPSDSSQEAAAACQAAFAMLLYCCINACIHQLPISSHDDAAAKAQQRWK